MCDDHLPKEICMFSLFHVCLNSSEYLKFNEVVAAFNVNACLAAAVWWLRSEGSKRGKHSWKMKSTSPLSLSHHPISLQALQFFVPYLVFASKDKYNMQGVGVLAWNCEMLRMFFCVEMYLVNAPLKMLLNNPLLIWCDLLDFPPALWLISQALLWLASALIPS